MRPALRLTKRSDGGFRLEGAAAGAIVGSPVPGGFAGPDARAWRLTWSTAERGWVLIDGDGATELGRTTAPGVEAVLAPASVLLADGRLFRLAFTGASAPRATIGRFDVPGEYAHAESRDGGWTFERTAAGEHLRDDEALWILACAEIGRLDGWW